MVGRCVWTHDGRARLTDELITLITEVEGVATHLVRLRWRHGGTWRNPGHLPTCSVVGSIFLIHYATQSSQKIGTSQQTLERFLRVCRKDLGQERRRGCASVRYDTEKLGKVHGAVLKVARAISTRDKKSLYIVQVKYTQLAHISFYVVHMELFPEVKVKRQVPSYFP